MKLKIIQFENEGFGTILDADTEVTEDGLTRINYKNSKNKKKSKILFDDVKPIVMQEKKRFNTSTNQYLFLCKDNFITPTKNNFKIQGKFTNEQFVQLNEHGFVKALMQGLAYENLSSGINKLVVIGVIFVVLFLIYMGLTILPSLGSIIPTF